MPEESKVFIETKLTARASKSLDESVQKDLLVEETEQSRAHLKELLKNNDCNKTKIHRD